MNEYTHFRKLVERMRAKQKAYYKAEHKTAEKQALLIEARELEQKVDAFLKVPAEPTLF